MDELDTPVLDNHMHLDPVNGRGVEAAEEFARFGGTHLLVLNKPSWNLVEGGHRRGDVPRGVRPDCRGDRGSQRGAGRESLAGSGSASRTHLTSWSTTVTPQGEARDIMQAGLDVAAEFVADGPALAIKSGRPHYDVDEAVWEASNEVMRHAFDLAGEVGCAVQLHTEGGEEFTEVADWAEDAGLPRERVVKHYSGGRLSGPIKSVISNREDLELAVAEDEPFLMETDYIDDPDRPGAVLGPKTVPRRVRWMLEEGWDEAVATAHVDTPARVYGIDTEATLAD